MGGFIAVVFWIGLTIGAFFQVGWIYSILMIALTVGILFLINSICKKADDQQKREKAKTIAKIVVVLSVAMIIVGFLMSIFCFLIGPTGYVDTFTECGLCGGSGIAFGKICSLCHGGGGASGSDARYTAGTYTWLGVLIVSSGVAIILGTKSIIVRTSITRKKTLFSIFEK